MFIPIENALITALEQDRNLFQYAYKKKVILVTPSTLFVSLKTIENGWKLDKRAKNISEVVNSAEELYSKVEKFINDIGKVEKSLDVAKNTFDDAYSELATGRGSLIRQIEIEILKDNSSKRKLKIES
jgi:DNA recombination protein RmuC